MKNKKIIPIIIAVVVVICAALGVIAVKGGGSKVNEAKKLLEAGDYDNAYAMLIELGEEEMVKENKYDRAMALIEEEDFAGAIALLTDLDYNDSEKKIEEIIASNPSLKLSLAEIGSYVTLGSYEQDNDTSNGNEEIEWRVLAKEDDKVLLISRYALDCKQYHDSYEETSWETCTLRSWLNNDFMSAAFSDDEQAMIETTALKAAVNPGTDADPGNDTEDKIFVLSIDDAKVYFATDEDRMCTATDYAEANGVELSPSYKADGKAAAQWWLRAPGKNESFATYVYPFGTVYTYGNGVNYVVIGVRPAMWVSVK